MKLEDIKGMGTARIRKLQAAGITEPLDLLLHFPYKYVDLNAPVEVSSLRTGDELTVHGRIENDATVQFLRKGLRMTKATVRTDFGAIEAVWFNQKYMASALPRGKEVFLTGKVKRFRNKISLSAPTLLHPDGKTVVPVYRPIPGIPQRVFSDAVDVLLERANIQGYISDAIRRAHRLLTLDEAFREVHRPHGIASAQEAARTLSLEKLGYTLGTFRLVKSIRGSEKKFVYDTGEAQLRQAAESLPFRLTESQQRVLKEIVASLKGARPMNKLVQGDVGCGKTIVALLAMYFAYLNGYQSVLMAPTEILAMQHYKSAIRFLENLGVKAVLLCGSMSKAERDHALFLLRTQGADVIIGTHALLQDDVMFRNAALIVTDEQQRFGVNQRGLLENKAAGADTLVMTATPIPRTLALCMYGELEQSVIGGLPAGRPEIATSVVPSEKFDGMFDYVTAAVAKGEQTYIVCPRIERDDEEEDLVSVTELYAMLTKKYPSVSIGFLHGKCKETEKAEIMRQFASGEIGLLVATTVIEVGIDVPAATNMIIFNAERYGLSQLHQLRGRVGRGTKKSYCFLPIAGEVPERLRFFCTCRDGFELSEYDFAQRGAGDFIGTRQHGETDDLPVKIDAELIMRAKAIAEDMLRDEETRNRLQAGLTSGMEQYVRAITMN